MGENRLTQPMDRAILHSLIAGIYADYAVSNQWQLPTDEIGRPDTCYRYANGQPICSSKKKVRTNIKEAFIDLALLLKTSSRGYIPFVELGKRANTITMICIIYWLPAALKHCNGWKNLVTGLLMTVL